MTSLGRRALVLAALTAAIGAATLAPAAEVPGIRNARVEERAAAAGLEAAFRAAVASGAAPSWIGYSVPATGGHGQCCWSSSDEAGGCCGGCRLEGEGSFRSSSGPGGTVSLESSGRLRVLFRVEGRRVGRLRTFSEECALDAGGLTFVWLDGVRPAESLRLLASYVGADAEESASGRLTESAVAAIAFHDDPGADTLLESFTASDRPDRLRKKAAFWMGNARGRRGFETLKRLVKQDASESFRSDVVFALTQSREAETDDLLIDTARHDASSHVRGQALFWLGQKAGRKASAALTGAIENDPETEVKKKAVFALSQLPRDEGIPLLIRTARDNRNPSVRKQAMFWLGQSGDPRALAFFEEVLGPRPKSAPPSR